MRATIVETPDFGDADVMVETCYTELIRAGFTKEADSIRGLEIFSLSGACAALATLKQIHVSDENVGGAVRYAIAMLEALVKPARQLDAVG